MQWSLRISSCVPLPSQEPRNQAGGSPCPLLIPCRGRGLDSLFLSQIIPFDYLNLPILLRPIFLTPLLRRGVKKSGYFTVRLTVRGGRGSATSALTISKCENFDLFFIEIWFFDTQNTFYLIVRGLKNAFFMPFSWLSKWGAGFLQMIPVVAWKLCKIRFTKHRVIL